MEPWVCLQGEICMNRLWGQRGGGEKNGSNLKHRLLLILLTMVRTINVTIHTVQNGFTVCKICRWSPLYMYSFFTHVSSSFLSIQFAITFNRKATSLDESQKMKQTNVLECTQSAGTVNCDVMGHKRVFALRAIACLFWTYVMLMPLTIQELDTEASLECHTRSASGKLLSCQTSFMQPSTKPR